MRQTGRRGLGIPSYHLQQGQSRHGEGEVVCSRGSRMARNAWLQAGAGAALQAASNTAPQQPAYKRYCCRGRCGAPRCRGLQRHRGNSCQGGFTPALPTSTPASTFQPQAQRKPRSAAPTPNVGADCDAHSRHFKVWGVQMEVQDVAPVDGMVQNLREMVGRAAAGCGHSGAWSCTCPHSSQQARNTGLPAQTIRTFGRSMR